MMYLLYDLVSPVVYLSVWMTVANSQGTVGGLSANDFVTYYLTLILIDQFTNDITIHILAYKNPGWHIVQRTAPPGSPILTSTLTYNIGL